MLACELDLPMGIDVPLTILSSVLAVVFTFTALASDLLWERYKHGQQKRNRSGRNRRARSASLKALNSIAESAQSSRTPLLPTEQEEEQSRVINEVVEWPSRPSLLQRLSLEANGSPAFEIDTPLESPKPAQPTSGFDPMPHLLHLPLNDTLPLPTPPIRPGKYAEARNDMMLRDDVSNRSESTDALNRTFSESSVSRRSSSFNDSTTGSFGLGNFMSVRPYRQSTASAKAGFVTTGKVLYQGSTVQNTVKSFIWSLAITSMHYCGIAALRIPRGYFTLDPLLVVTSGMISWVVCLVGCILMAHMETHLGQQFLFTVVATTGVAAMHFTGMRAASFWSDAPPSEASGYPPGLAIAIASIAITTCIGANGLLAHTATISRDKLADIVYTRRKLWMAIAQKENAEAAAAARSDFIASASHEIRTPLHHLQGYSDLLSRTELTEEGRVLLYAIQRATKTLSLITNNVLDWSRLERDGETICRPVALDIRTICESVICLLPNKDDDSDVELLVVIAPDVPDSLFLDETYIHRILMNLLSNALKFTFAGYVFLLIEMKADKLVATVKDTGSGVPASFLPLLFEPFKQAQTRGSQRGTGLGLSIVRQLLLKMGGSIDVDSKHWEEEDVATGQAGSTFTVTIPVQLSTKPQQESLLTKVGSKIAIFHEGDGQYLQALRTAWEKFDYETQIVKQFSDLSTILDLKYIWAELPCLKHNSSLLRQLLDQDRWLVLIPYDTQTALREVPGLLQCQHFIPIQKPLIWHSIKKSIDGVSQASREAAPPRTVRFAPTVDVLNGGDMTQPHQETAAKPKVVLLVEDNPINRKLGNKMLTALGYQVLFAEDGQEAIEQIIKHDSIIDVILMDQSMPRKDGLTATKEIRAMEAEGVLSRRRPIIAVTAVVSAQAQALCKSAGTDDFLAKPLSMGKLEQSLTTHLS